MRNRRLTGAAAFAAAVTIATVHAQVGRGGSEWLTARGDAQRTSWIRTDPKISVESLSAPGFELQWKRKLDNANRHAYGLGQGVSANGVTLFIPMTVVTGSSNNVYALDNDTGYVVWQRHFDAPLAPATAACPGGITSAATRIVSLTPPPIAAPAGGGGRAAQPYRSVIGQPGEGAPVETRGGGAGRAGAVAGGAGLARQGAGASDTTTPAGRGARGGQGAAAPGAGAPGAPAAAGAAPQRGGGGGGGGFGGAAGPAIPGATPEQLGGRGGLARASGVAYAISSDGVLHVMGLPSGKDIQKPAEFVPANARWSDAIAVNTSLYTTTSGGCGGAPNAVWAIDLESEGKPVVSWKSGGPIVGAVAFTTDGTLVAAVGPAAGASSGGKPNAIVTLDAKTLQVKDWFSAPSTEFATGPTILRHGDEGKELIAAATKDGRIVVLDPASLGGSDHATPLASASLGGPLAAGEALANWQQITVTAPPAAAAPAAGGAAPAPAAQAAVTYGARWILAPLARSIVAFKVVEHGATIALERGWAAENLASPATPVIVNGVVFALARGAAAAPAVLHAYDGTSGKELWTSGKTITTPAAPGSFWSAFGQTYVGGTDGTLYAFGFLDERR